MTPAQREAMDRVAKATEPVKVPGPTARILANRYGYIEADGNGWRLTPRGRQALAAERNAAEHRAAVAKLTPEAREWAHRVQAWLEAHKRFKLHEIHMWRYARHVAACDFDGVEPVPTEAWSVELREWVEQAVRSAAKILRDFDAQMKVAVERGVGVTVDYEADPRVPRSRREAARAAAEGSGTVVSLSTYREHRPGPDGAA